MTDVALHKGHMYRAALSLGILESAFAGQIPGQLEALGFTDVELWDDASKVPVEFTHAPDLTKIANANHWAEGVYQGDDGAVHPIPSQVLVLRDDGVATSTKTPALPPGSPTTVPAKKDAKGKSLPMPPAGSIDPACPGGYQRPTVNSACYATVPPGSKRSAGLSQTGVSTAAKKGLAAVGLAALGGIIGVVTVRLNNE